MNMNRSDISRFLGENWFRFITGWAFANVLNGVVQYLILVKVWQSTIEYYGIPFLAILIIMPFVFGGGVWLLGYLIISKNVLAAQNSLQNRQANPEFMMFLEQANRMEQKLDDIQKRMGER